MNNLKGKLSINWKKTFKNIKENNHTYIVKGKKIKKISTDDMICFRWNCKFFSNQMKRVEIEDKLKGMGIKSGNIIKILD